ncbi:MAG: pseudouridine synthase [Candidatus Magasanikbacteria bacterium]
MPLVRINKYLAQEGYCSRRKADELISLGKVEVNGKVIKEFGIKIDPDSDRVSVSGHEQRRVNDELIYIVLNKPLEFITSTSDAQGRTILSLLRKERATGRIRRDITERVYPVGRLDKDSEGLVLMTNDGELTNMMTHPSYEHEKEYEIILDAPLSKDAEKVLQSGMNIGNDSVKGIKILKKARKGKFWVISVILKEGKNRQIKKMFGRIGYNIQNLKRVRMGKLRLGSLALGQWKFVKKEDIL